MKRERRIWKGILGGDHVKLGLSKREGVGVRVGERIPKTLIHDKDSIWIKCFK